LPSAARDGPPRRKPIVVTAEADTDARAAAEELERAERGLGDAFEEELAATIAGIADGAELVVQVTGSIGRTRVGAFAWAVVYAVESRRVVVAALVRVRPKVKPGA
jgi:hypothetical protein